MLYMFLSIYYLQYLIFHHISCGAGLNPSLLTDFFRSRTLYPRIDTLYLVCEGMGITLEEFFKDPMFNIENIEIKDSKD